MLLSEPQTTINAVVRISPQAKLPAPEVARTLSPADLKLLRCTLAAPAEYVPNPRFEAADAGDLLRPVPPRPADADDSGVHRLTDDPEPPPGLEREQHIFLQLNLLRRHVVAILQQHAGRRLSAKAAEELLHWQRQVQELRSRIVHENLPLVLAMAKRTRIRGVDPADLVSEGNLALLRAANKFDCARGYRFSTYACRAILKSFSRVATRTSRHRGRFPTEFDPALEKSHHVERQRRQVVEDCIGELRTILDTNLGKLTDVERQVIQARFALDGVERQPAVRGKTLEQVGELIGVTKERVRQIQNKALNKLRTALDQAVLTR